MDPQALSSTWAKKFYSFHKEVLVRRVITKELSKENQEYVVLKPMLKYYVSTVISTGTIVYLARLQPFHVRFVLPSAFFSLTFLYLQVFHEEKVFLAKGMEDSYSGKVIRDNYQKLLPDHWLSKKFKTRSDSLQAFHTKYHHRASPLDKFGQYAESRNFPLIIN